MMAVGPLTGDVDVDPLVSLVSPVEFSLCEE